MAAFLTSRIVPAIPDIFVGGRVWWGTAESLLLADIFSMAVMTHACFSSFLSVVQGGPVVHLYMQRGRLQFPVISPILSSPASSDENSVVTHAAMCVCVGGWVRRFDWRSRQPNIAQRLHVCSGRLDIGGVSVLRRAVARRYSDDFGRARVHALGLRGPVVVVAPPTPYM